MTFRQVLEEFNQLWIGLVIDLDRYRFHDFHQLSCRITGSRPALGVSPWFQEPITRTVLYSGATNFHQPAVADYSWYSLKLGLCGVMTAEVNREVDGLADTLHAAGGACNVD
jgi:hypothetical protein